VVANALPGFLALLRLKDNGHTAICEFHPLRHKGYCNQMFLGRGYASLIPPEVTRVLWGYVTDKRSALEFVDDFLF
jgi:hypothetical protein